MLSLEVKAALLGLVLLGLAGNVLYIQHIRHARDAAVQDAAAYRQVAIANYRYIDLYNKEKAANDQWESEANNEADKIVETGCPKLPADFRAFVKRL